MSKFYYINPIGKESPDLFQTFTPTLLSEGHQVVDRVEDADVVFWDFFSGMGKYDSGVIGKLFSLKVPICVFDETDFHGMSKEVWDVTNWSIIAKNQKLIYFMRKMGKDITYPPYVFPYEKVVMNEFPLTSPEELNSRPMEIFFYGNTSPQRKSVTDELSKHFKCDFTLGQEKIPHEQWLQRARQAKVFLTSDGGGVSDERPYQLFSISVMLRQKNNHLQVNPFTDCVNCLEVSEHPTEDEIKGIRAVLDDPEYLFEIYEAGIQHMKQYYNETERTMYILRTLEKEGIL